MSGGKDSTACALLLERHGIEFERVFMDTGWEHPALYDYLSDVLEPRFGPITRIKSEKHPGGMKDLIRARGMFPSGKIRFCTYELKVKPFHRWVEAQDGPVVSVLGIRRSESATRATAERWRYDEALDIDVFSPLVDHTFEDIISMHHEGGVVPNPLYLQGSSRVGCFPCIFSRKSEIEQLDKLWPDRVAEIAELESEITTAARQRNPEAERRTFFSNRSAALGTPGIVSMVEWAKTTHGGRQLKLFDLTSQDGCTRWGMCESPLASSELVTITERAK